jgi:hypothetical protein
MATSVRKGRKARGAQILLEILRSEGVRFVFGIFVVLNNLEYGILKSFMLDQPQYNAKEHPTFKIYRCKTSRVSRKLKP